MAGWPSFPPISGTEWLVLSVSVAGFVALIGTMIPGRTMFAILTALVMITASRFLFGGIPFGDELRPWSQ